jgi:LuxR family transcriptional regulator, maltose regulon positive regulatory protein
MMAARSEPAIAIGRLRANGRLDQVLAGSMAMTRGEAAETLGAMDRNLSFDQLQRLVELTEGWPAALYLAGWGLGGDEDPDRVVESFNGTHRAVVDYVRSEFLDQLAADDRELLLSGSLFDELSGELCDAVLERSGTGMDLRRLSRTNLLITPMDSADRRFHMHGLMREALRSELRLSNSGAEPVLHRRASDWFWDRNDIDAAVRQAIAAGDTTLAGGRIWSASMDYIGRGRRATVASWIAAFSDEQISSDPSLSMVCAVGAMADGDGSGAQSAAGNAATLFAAGVGHPDPSVAAAAEVVAILRDEHSRFDSLPERLGKTARRLIDQPLWRTLAGLMAGAITHLMGDRDGARSLLDEVVRKASGVAPAIENLAHAQLCLIALDEGRVGAAEDAASLATRLIDLHSMEDYSASGMPFAAMALVKAQRGDTDGARTALAASERLLKQMELSGWFDAQVRLTSARALIALGSGEEARKLLEEAAALSKPFSGATVLEVWTAAALEALELTTEANEHWPLTQAELRLLPLLPTHLTFSAIGDRLGVSTNTVKTQARSIYRKLGVFSRSEAVACAEGAGLLPRGLDEHPTPGSG